MSRTIRLSGRRLTVWAPAEDYGLLHFSGSSFSEFAAFCRRHLRAGDVVVDIGANIGLSSLVARDTVGGSGRILAIEASGKNCAALRRNFADHGLDPSLVIHAAAGSEPGTAAFHEASTFGHVVTGAGMRTLPHVPTPVRTVDEIVAAIGLARVDFIKIDVEGFERQVLEGARETLARHDPVVLLEFNSWCLIAAFDGSPRAFLDWLLATFPQLCLWRDRQLVSVRDMGAFTFLHDHIVRHGALDDLVGATASARLRPEPLDRRSRWHLGRIAARFRGARPG